MDDGSESGASTPRSISSLGSLDDVFSDITLEQDPAVLFEIPRCPTLADMCIGAIVANFSAYPVLGRLPRKFQEKVVAVLPTDLPLAVVAAVVHDESYWRRRATARWSLCAVSAHGDSWKRLYFEKHVREALEAFVPDTMPIASLLRTFAIAAPYVRRVQFAQLPSRLDLSLVCTHMGLVAELVAEYGRLDLGMNFEWGALGASLADVRGISQALVECASLRALTVTNSAVDDERVRLLASGLLRAPRLTALDLSHNAIGDAGAVALARVLVAPDLALQRLVLANNAIGEQGGQALGQALGANRVLRELDLRLNRLGEGCAYICAGATRSTSLVRLSLAANRLDTVTAVAQLRELLRLNSSITELDVSSNRIMSKLGAKIRDGIEANRTLLVLDVRATEISREALVAIETALAANMARARELVHH